MADIYYINSEGKRIDFDNKTYYLNRATSLFAHKWEYVNSEYLDKIDTFNKKFVEKEFNIGILAASNRDYDKALRPINDAFDIDVRKVTPGRLYCGEDYLNCYIIECNQQVYDTRANVVVKPYRLVAENGDWINEKYFATIKSQSDNGLDFMFDYPYDFAFSEDANYINNSTVAGADFIMKMYGAVSLPSVEIAGVEYSASVEVVSGGYLEINSIDKTVYNVDSYGNKTNVFDKRNRFADVFAQIPPGKWYMNRNDSFDVAIQLFMYKSEPDWWKE